MTSVDGRIITGAARLTEVYHSATLSLFRHDDIFPGSKRCFEKPPGGDNCERYQCKSLLNHQHCGWVGTANNHPVRQ